MTPGLEVRELVMDYASRRGRVRALDGVDLVVAPAEVIGIVGESGSGKSTLGAAIGRLPVPGVRHVSGEVLIGGRAIFSLGDDDLRALRRSELGFVFQDPLAALDPTMKIGAQVAGVLEGPRNNAAVDAVLTRVGLTEVRRVARSYPHELSGGMAQRVAIGIGVANRPKVLVADEPTAALDAAIKLQILDLLVSRSRDLNAALILLSHDLLAVRACADRIAVMYAGRIIEIGATATVLDRPLHPYTAALLRAAVGREAPGDRLEPIRGAPASFDRRLEHCAFAPRCAHATEPCFAKRPEVRPLAHRDIACHHAEDILASRGQCRG